MRVVFDHRAGTVMTHNPYSFAKLHLPASFRNDRRMATLFNEWGFLLGGTRREEEHDLHLVR
ncbi:hypothetical protein [Agrobacterium tumefaciens]|uniref:hypothetical protein n=1 Tax=Agrobacterium tumefaciens TaxID=358 RepID=UPI001573F01F|nr:hypothetical protein [Agrobacterium tumefaciens]NTA17271.1 hypothetical protein [Agrobacterium tumefaciens]WCK72591.1 hypothetical protein G6L96_015470 [Agrobacterium tumefaciens]